MPGASIVHWKFAFKCREVYRARCNFIRVGVRRLIGQSGSCTRVSIGLDRKRSINRESICDAGDPRGQICNSSVNPLVVDSALRSMHTTGLVEKTF